MKLIGQEEIWKNIKKANAIPRAWAWFQGALAGLLGFVRQIPALFVAALRVARARWTSSSLPRAFVKVGGGLRRLHRQFITWAGQPVWNLLEIIFEVVAPAVHALHQEGRGRVQEILKNPIGFVGNLVRAGKPGFRSSPRNFCTHLSRRSSTG